MRDNSALQPANPGYRTVTVDRDPAGVLHARNVRDGTLAVGHGDDGHFTPTELLLAAIATCTAADVDALTTRRAEPESFVVQVEALKVRDDDGNRLSDVTVTFRVAFPEGADGDAARAVLPEAVRRSHDRLCTVGRTVELATPVETRIEG
ncbi:MAG TPA: OsmC family protein [Actinomycetes bacterium]|nr:OsmC family protein [Actinomycetes bacterium]